MMRSRRRSKRNSFSRRPVSPGATGKVILIVTEGEKTEPDYLIGLRRHLKLNSAEIKVLNADGTDPLTIVSVAIEQRDEQKRKASQGFRVPYDSVWAVFDTERADTNPKLNDALQKAKAHKVNVAISNPCFEFWLLLHDEYTTAPFVDCDNVISRIRKPHSPNYEKGKIVPDKYIPKIPTAVQNSEKCRDHHRATGRDGNPSTDVDLLVREMNGATRAHNRIDI